MVIHIKNTQIKQLVKNQKIELLCKFQAVFFWRDTGKFFK